MATNDQCDFDLVVLGGGCAGLSLASRLADLGHAAPRTLVLEARENYVRDRTWCFWEAPNPAARQSNSHYWRTISIRKGDSHVTVDCGATPYQMLTADSFYNASTRLISRNTRIKLSMSSPVQSQPKKVEGRWVVETPSGPISTQMIVDTRPAKRPLRGDAILWQSFLGAEIVCEEPVFDTGCTTLMDFSTDRIIDIQFTYILPVASNRALIETTVFGADPRAHLSLTQDLDLAIAKATDGSQYKTLHTEHGILPMGNAPVPKAIDKSYIRAGLGSGGARPSTGYAFQRIQRWAEACAAELAAGHNPISHQRDPLLLRGMDQLFLSVLRAHPAEAPAMFFSLFSKVAPERMIRFLSDKGSLIDYLCVVSALPVLPFLREIPVAIKRAGQLRKASWAT